MDVIIARMLSARRGALARGAILICFTPNSDLMRQSRYALAAQCPGLRQRDLATDRLPRGTARSS